MRNEVGRVYHGINCASKRSNAQIEVQAPLYSLSINLLHLFVLK